MEETRICICGCEEKFICKERSRRRYINGHARKGAKHKQKAKDLISKANKGRKHTQEWKDKISKILLKKFKITGSSLRKQIEYYVNENDCHVCTSHWKDHDGYPQYFLKKRMPIGRYIYMKNFGEIPEGKVIRHTCDNRACINPEHLLLGTQKDNVRDCVIRGRTAKGENNGCVKLKKEQVIEIRKLFKTGKYTFAQLSRKFGVYSVRDIIYKNTWKHIEDE